MAGQTHLSLKGACPVFLGFSTFVLTMILIKTFTKIILNIMTNFIPNEIKKIIPCDPSWITKPLKTMPYRKNRLFKNYGHAYKPEDNMK